MISVHFFELFWLIAFAVGIIHFTRKNGWLNASLFFGFAFIWGFLIEYFGTNFHHIYTYPAEYWFVVGNVPLSIAAGWAVIIYVGYFIVQKTFHLKEKWKTDTSSAFLATAFDFILLEPLAFAYRFWTWKQNDLWFGAPLFNFIGWFLIVTVFLISYQWAVKTHEKTETKLFRITTALVVGFLAVQLIGIGYYSLVGWF